ncbi:MAG: hypothetical protein N2C11_05700 [Planococcus sp. (in: firmicutes)]
MKKGITILFFSVLAISSLSLGNNLSPENEVAVQARVPEPWATGTEVAVQARVPEPWATGTEVAVQARVPEPWAVESSKL